MSDDDGYTFIDRLQDLGAWILLLGVPIFLLALITYLLGVY